MVGESVENRSAFVHGFLKMIVFLLYILVLTDDVEAWPTRIVAIF